MKFHPQINDNTSTTTATGAEIQITDSRQHKKASELYLDIDVEFPKGQHFKWSVPTEYRRTGVDLGDWTTEVILNYIIDFVEACNPANWAAWRKEQRLFWAKKRATVTKPFFDALSMDFTWKSGTTDLPNNPNPQRRIQDLKEMGYTIATHTRMHDRVAGKNCTHHILLPLPRGGITGYETISPALTKRIITLLAGYDAFEGKIVKKDSLLADHKFPEIRWDDETQRESLEHLNDDELRNDFQLVNNQRNQQKREVCRLCFQTGKRPYPFGVRFYYEGNEDWSVGVPTRGKQAEAGCVGCGWYDLEKWRKALTQKLDSAAEQPKP